MTKRRSAYDAMRAMTPEPTANELAAAQRILHERIARDTNVRPLPAMRRAQSRKWRRPVEIGVAACVLAATFLIGGLYPKQFGEHGTPAFYVGALPASAAEEQHCGTHPDDSLSQLPRERWAEHPGADAVMIGLPRADVLGEPSLGTWTPACTAVPTALYLDEEGERGIVVYRNVLDPFVGTDGLEDVTVRGAQGVAKSLDSGLTYLTWTDSEDVRWLAVANGVTRDNLVAAVGGAAGTALKEIRTPAGFTSVALDTRPETTATNGLTWTVQYGATNTASDRGSGVEALPENYAVVEVRTPAVAPAELAVATLPGARIVNFDGRAAVFTPDIGGGTSLRWISGDTYYRLGSTAASLDELETLARRLVPAHADGTPRSGS